MVRRPTVVMFFKEDCIFSKKMWGVFYEASLYFPEFDFVQIDSHQVYDLISRGIFIGGSIETFPKISVFHKKKRGVFVNSWKYNEEDDFFKKLDSLCAFLESNI